MCVSTKPQVGFIASLRNEHTHDVVAKALLGLSCMEHRGACSADDVSGDGSGVMTKIPWQLLAKQFPDLDEAHTGVGMIFMPNDDALVPVCKQVVEEAAAAEGLSVIGWRDVPVDQEVVGRMARATQPRIVQVLVRADALQGDELERELFILRKGIERRRAAALKERAEELYVCTLSSRTIVYKGMLQSSALGRFYKDLTDPDYVTPFAIYHRRFSTNTTPKWPLAQPMRVLGHNGEINTLQVRVVLVCGHGANHHTQGNLNWVASREKNLSNPIWKGREAEFLPLCNAAEVQLGCHENSHFMLLLVHSLTRPTWTTWPSCSCAPTWSPPRP